MRKVIFRAVTTVAMLAGIACLAQRAWADSLTGLKFLQAQGPTTFLAAGANNPDVPGSLTLTGLIDFDNKGGAKSLHATLIYTSLSDVSADIQCSLDTPADVTDNFDASTGVGTFALKLNKNDSCLETQLNQPFTGPFAGTSITFNMYHKGASSKIVSISSGLIDADKNAINIVNVTGSLDNAP